MQAPILPRRALAIAPPSRALRLAAALALGVAAAWPVHAQTGSGEGTLGGPRSTAPTGGAAGARDAAMGQQASLAREDIAFLKQAAENNHAEIESSRIAMQKAKDPKVKAFAQQMVEDHGKAGQEMTALASSKAVDLPNGPSLIQKGKAKLLETADGDDFDKRYTETMAVQAHRETIELYEKASRDAKDAQIKAFATKMLPSLRHHLEMARQLPAAPK